MLTVKVKGISTKVLGALIDLLTKYLKLDLQCVPLVIVFGCAVLLAIPFLILPVLPGYDTMSHVARVYFLIYSLGQGNLTGWSWFWYMGAQLYDTYTPLFYYVSASLSLPFAGDAMWGTKLSIALSLILSGLAMYYFLLEFVSNRFVACGGAVFYVIAPPTF